MANVKRFSPLPGFGLAMGYTLVYLTLIVLIPLAAVGTKTLTMGWEAFWAAVSSPRVVASYQLSFAASLLAAAINVVFGLIFAWVLVRYRFPGKVLIDSLVDLPFALPTAVAGIALATIYSENGPVGKLLEPWASRSRIRRTAFSWRWSSSAYLLSCAPYSRSSAISKRKSRRPRLGLAPRAGRPSCASSCRTSRRLC